MKKIIYLLPLLLVLLTSGTVFSQKYKTAADTVKLNKEYAEISNDIAQLTSKLTAAQNGLPGYQSKAKDETSDAQNAAAASSEQAVKATGNDVGDSKKAKRKAKKALGEAKDAKDANNEAADQQKKIEKLTGELDKKKKRLQELDEMRTAINGTKSGT